MHRKDMIQMVVTIVIIVAAFYAIQYFFFPPKMPVPVPAADNQPAANQPAANQPAANTPIAEAPVEPKPAETVVPGMPPLTRESARTFTLANTRLTAVFSERGAVLERLSYIDSSGNPVFLRTPNDPTEKPSEVLELIRPATTAQHAAPLALRMDERDPQRNLSRWELTRGPVANQNGAQELTFRFPPVGSTTDEVVVYKTFALHPGSYRIDVTLRLENTGSTTLERTVGLWGPGAITNDGIRQGADHTRVALYGSTASKRYTDLFESPNVSQVVAEIDDINADRQRTGDVVDNRALDDVTNPDRFLLAHGVRTQYFIAFLAGDPDKRDGRWSGDILALRDVREAAVSLIAPPLQVTAAQSGAPGTASVRMSFYAGPRDKEVLEAAWLDHPPADTDLLVEWRELAPTGWPAIISAPFVSVLRWLASGVGPGFAIILLTLIVRALLSPLSYRGQKSMAVYTQKMKVVKPQLDKIKEKYAGKKDRDSQLKMLTETREAMKAQNVGMLPLGGCLPMLIQLPIFIGLYRAFGSAFLFRQAEFLWIRDLSLPDATIPASFEVSIPLLQSFLTHNGFLTINLLPVIWIVLSLMQMRMQPKPEDPQQAAMQKQMGCIFPLMGLFFYAFASGFAFYFIFSGLFSLGESKLIKRNLIKAGIMPPPRKDKPGPNDKPQYHTK